MLFFLKKCYSLYFNSMVYTYLQEYPIFSEKKTKNLESSDTFWSKIGRSGLLDVYNTAE